MDDSRQQKTALNVEKKRRGLILPSKFKLPQHSPTDKKGKQECCENASNVAVGETPINKTLDSKVSSVTCDVQNKSSTSVQFACLSGKLKFDSKIQTRQIPMLNNNSPHPDWQAVDEQKLRTNSEWRSLLQVPENPETCCVKSSLQQSNEHIASQKHGNTGAKVSCVIGNLAKGQPRKSQTNEHALNGKSLISADENIQVSDKQRSTKSNLQCGCQKLTEKKGSVVDASESFSSNDKRSSIPGVHDNCMRSVVGRRGQARKRPFISNMKTKFSKRKYTKSTARLSHKESLYDCSFDHTNTNNSLRNDTNLEQVSRLSQSEKCAADSTSRLEHKNSGENTLSTNTSIKLEFKPLLASSSVMKPEISTVAKVLGPAANPIVSTSIRGLPYVAVPGNLDTNSVVKSLESKYRLSHCAPLNSMPNMGINRPGQLTLKDIFNVSSPSIIPSFTNMIHLNPSTRHPSELNKKTELRRRLSDSESGSTRVSELKIPKLVHSQKQDQTRPYSVTVSEIRPRDRAEHQHCHTHSVREILKEKPSLKHKSHLEMHEQYLKAKMDLMSNLPDRSGTTPVLPMHTALLPVPSWIDKLDQVFQVGDSDATIDSEENVTPLDTYTPTDKDFDLFLQGEVPTKADKSTLCEPIDFLDLFVPDSTVDGNVSRKSCERIESDHGFTATSLNEYGQMELAGDHSGTTVAAGVNMPEGTGIIDLQKKNTPPLTEGGKDFLSLDTGNETVLDELVSALADDSLMSGFQANVQELAKVIQFNSQDFRGFDGYFSDDLLCADEMGDVGNGAGKTDKCSGPCGIDIPRSSQSKVADGRRPEYRSARAPAKFGFWKQRKYEKRFPASYLKSKSKNDPMILEKKFLMETAERFLGDDFNDKDKRSCRGKAINSCIKRRKGSKGSLQNYKTDEKGSGKQLPLGTIGVKQPPSTSNTCPKKGKMSSYKAEVDEEVPEPRVTRQQTNLLKETMTNHRPKSTRVKSETETIIKKEPDLDKGATDDMHATDTKSKTPKLPTLKLQSVKKVKNSMKKMWSIKNINKSPQGKLASTEKKTSNGPPQQSVNDKESSQSKQFDQKSTRKPNASPDVKKTPSRSKQKEHGTPKVTPTPGTEISCKMCDHTCATRERMERHYSRQHPRWCFQCDKRFKSIEAFKLHLTKNHDTLIYCSICSTKFYNKTNYLRHLKTQLHIKNVQHLKRVLGIKRNREPSLTLVISSDDEDEDPLKKPEEVLVLDSNDEGDKTEDEALEKVEKDDSQGHESSTELDQETIKHDNFELATLLVRGKETSEGTKCKTCKHFFKKFTSHCKSTKHIEKFKTSKLYQKYTNMRKPIPDDTTGACTVQKPAGNVLEVCDETDWAESFQEACEFTEASEGLEDSGVYVEMADGEPSKTWSVEKDSNKGNSIPEVVPVGDQLQVRYRPVYRSPILTTLASVTASGICSPSLAGSPEIHHTHRYSTPKLEPCPTWDSGSDQNENLAALHGQASGSYRESSTVASAIASVPGATSFSEGLGCSPTMLVKNISAEIDKTEFGQNSDRMNIFDSFTGDHIKVLSKNCTIRQYRHNPLIDQIVKNKERIEMLKKERIERKNSPMRSPSMSSPMGSPRQTHYTQSFSPVRRHSNSSMRSSCQPHVTSDDVTASPYQTLAKLNSPVAIALQVQQSESTSDPDNDQDDDIPACNQVYIVGDEPVDEEFCVIENVETLSKESFQLLFDSNNNRREQL